jgi:hypothetical protein
MVSGSAGGGVHDASGLHPLQGILKGFRDSTFIIDLEHLPYTATTIVVSLTELEGHPSKNHETLKLSRFHK